MRKLFILLAAAAVAIGVLSPAEAAGTYKISLDPAPAGKTSTTKSYNDTALDVSEDTDDGRQKTTIRGRVSGGPVKGQRVVIYATNTNLADAPRVRLGSATLSSSGVFTKAFSPGHDHAGVYRIEIVKAASGDVAGTTKTFRIRVFQFVEMRNVYDTDASVRASRGGVGEADKEKFGRNSIYGQSYFINGDSRAVFRTAGYNCMQLNFKIGISHQSKVGGKFAVLLNSDTLVSTRSMSKGQRHYEPSRTTQKKMRSSADVTVRVSRYSDGDPDTVDDQRRLRYVLGRPMASCTYPVVGQAVPTP
ncbi:hypothetical protein [Aeromicrobium stalagmiti]|uniref:hypothetical protein n=1 Tax=Aeromicrobium stalagmiti TaxID=2738988 RepID=UPI001569E268|nr:hypothetical protein [Aeromicrobium stalagmiti]NRQ48881.1 hypothetical protein [Aeromicrobium stalagmiti]